MLLNEQPSNDDATRGAAVQIAGVVVLLALLAASAWLRVHAALHDPNFDAANPIGMLRSDPALLYYFVERILEAGGGIPADFRADPRILHPQTTDVLAQFPLGIEWIVAWCRGRFEAETPLHVVCVRVAAVCAASAIVGVYGLAFELTRRVRWAVLAAALWAVTAANYRTVGFVLVGEDASLPLFALHLWLFARAFRVRSAMSIALAALTLVASASTWHAASFFVLLEAAAVFAWYTLSGHNALGARRAWLGLALVQVVAWSVPVLRSTGFALSLPVIVAIALWTSARLQERASWNRRVAWCACAGIVIVLAGASLAASRVFGGGVAEYSHVWGLLVQKLAHFGQLPADPLELPAEVRLMWQGPFATADIGWLVKQLGLGLVFALAFVCAPLALARDGHGARAVLAFLFAISIAAAWLIVRTSILPGLLVPVAAVCAASGVLARVTPRSVSWLPGVLLAGCVVLQGVWTFQHFASFSSSWYVPPQRQLEIRALVNAIPDFVPPDEAIAADFVNSTAILAYTRRPIVLQPKYEDRESRERAIEFFTTFHHGTPEELRQLLTRKYRCRYLVVDRFTLGMLPESLYLGGVRKDEAPRPGTCRAVFCSQDPAELARVPGFELLYRSPPTIRFSGAATDFFRLYRLSP